MSVSIFCLFGVLAMCWLEYHSVVWVLQRAPRLYWGFVFFSGQTPPWDQGLFENPIFTWCLVLVWAEPVQRSNISRVCFLKHINALDLDTATMCILLNVNQVAFSIELIPSCLLPTHWFGRPLFRMCVM